MAKFISIVSLIIFMQVSFTFAGDIKGTIKAKGAKHAGDAVVFIEKIDGKTFEAPKENAVMSQKDLTFIPHVLPVLVGATVDFPNNDDVLHNVFTPDKCAERFNLGTWPKGQKRSYTFKKPGCDTVLLCNVHSDMEAYIIVLETPFFAVSDKDGGYIIKDVPPGKYNLKIWHEKLKGKEQEVMVPEKGEVSVDFVIKR